MNKTILLFILFLLPLFTFAQSKKSIDGFLDIPFGSDSATVKAAVIAKGGLIVDTLSHKDFLVFSGFTMSTRKVSALQVRFVDNKAYQADFVFNDFIESEVIDFYNNLSDDITAVYGKGTVDDNFGNSNITTLIKRLKSGNAACSTVWLSKNKNDGIRLTYISFNQLINVNLEYQDVALWNLNASKRRSDL